MKSSRLCRGAWSRGSRALNQEEGSGRWGDPGSLLCRRFFWWEVSGDINNFDKYFLGPLGVSTSREAPGACGDDPSLEGFVEQGERVGEAPGVAAVSRGGLAAFASSAGCLPGGSGIDRGPTLENQQPPCSFLSLRDSLTLPLGGLEQRKIGSSP